MGGRPRNIPDVVELLVARAIGRNLTPFQGFVVQFVAIILVVLFVMWLFSSGLFFRIVQPFVDWYVTQVGLGPSPTPRP
jgi:hypothetical protein